MRFKGLVRFVSCAVALGAALPAAAQGPAAATAASLLGQPKYAAVLVDARSGEVLYTRQADATRFPASITKVMTLYLAFEQMAAGRLRLDDRIVVSRFAANQRPSRLGLKPGETISVDECIRAIALKSANDMAAALAEHIAGSEPAFAALMTSRARALGMSGTTFTNASGLPDPRHVSTARDIATLSRAMIRSFPQYYGYFQQQQFAFAGTTMTNHNKLLGAMPGVDGIKTGYTAAAGFTLAASAVRDGRRLIAVVLGGPSGRARDSNVASLLNAGFDVLDARQRGQRLQVADALYEPGDLNDETLGALVEQGSAPSAARPSARARGALSLR